MRRSAGFWQIPLGFLIAAALLGQGPGQARGASDHSYSRLERQTLVKDLGLTPETAKAFQAIGDKFDQSREGIIAGIKAKESDLEMALGAAKPDEMKIKGLVAALTQDHDQLFQSLKSQRQEEMALLTPIQQGKFLLALKKWHQEMQGGAGK
jgi:Spy/CpxP family protein refolding chaperone